MTGALYYSIHHWLDGPADTLERVTALRHAGIRGLEIGSRDGLDPSAVAAARAAAPEVLLHNYFPPADPPFIFNLASPDRGIRERSLRLAGSALRLSAEIGAPCYGVHGGFVTDAESFDGISFRFPPATDEDREQAEAWFVDAILALSRIAADQRVVLLVENNVCPERLRGRLLLQTPFEFSRLFGSLGEHADRVGILLDVGHLLVSSRTWAFDPLEFVAVHRSRIWGLHLHDNDRIEDRHAPLVADSEALEIASECREARWSTLEARCRTTSEIRAQLTLVEARLGR